MKLKLKTAVALGILGLTGWGSHVSVLRASEIQAESGIACSDLRGLLQKTRDSILKTVSQLQRMDDEPGSPQCPKYVNKLFQLHRLFDRATNAWDKGERIWDEASEKNYCQKAGALFVHAERLSERVYAQAVQLDNNPPCENVPPVGQP